MQLLDIIIYSVVLPSVTLAAVQQGYFKLPEKKEDWTPCNKVVGLAGLTAVGFTLFISPILLDGVECVLLIVLVLAILASLNIAGRIRERRELQREKKTIPERFIRSHLPDATLEWCAACQAHTKQGYKTRKVHSNDGPAKTRTVVCCDYCKAHLNWNKPVDIEKVLKQTLVCIAVIGLVMSIDFAVFSLWNGSGGLMTSLCLSVAILPLVVVTLIWVLYLRLQWCKWVTKHH